MSKPAATRSRSRRTSSVDTPMFTRSVNPSAGGRETPEVTIPAGGPLTAQTSCRVGPATPRRHSPHAFEPATEDVTFFDVYGDRDPLTPAELGQLMMRLTAPRWVAGGYALEAFTGIARSDDDIDVKHPGIGDWSGMPHELPSAVEPSVRPRGCRIQAAAP
jgi:hypothetical protein